MFKRVKRERIPEGGIYAFKKTVVKLEHGQKFPSKPSHMDQYFYGDYQYVYSENFKGWKVELNLHKTDRNQTHYGPILDCVGEMYVTGMRSTFAGCSKMTIAPTIPKYVKDMSYAFMDCVSLFDAPEIPDEVENMEQAFFGCKSIVTAPKIPDGVKNISFCFTNCDSLSCMPNIPYGIANVNSAFAGCKLSKLTSIPLGILDDRNMFGDCILSAIPEGYLNNRMFRGTVFDLKWYSIYIDEFGDMEYESFKNGQSRCVFNENVTSELVRIREKIKTDLRAEFMSVVGET